MKKRGEMRRERRSDKRKKIRSGRARREMEETGWRLKKTRMGTSGLY
jgi:hypothetical protein